MSSTSGFAYDERYIINVLCYCCRRPWEAPKEVLPCRHISCGGCIANSTHCAMCGATVTGSVDPSPQVVDSLRHLPVICQYCAWTGPVDEAPAHRAACVSPPSVLPPAALPVPPPPSLVGGALQPRCRGGYRCNNADDAHALGFTHPPGWQPQCRNMGRCADASVSHQQRFAHDVLPCPLGMNCHDGSDLHRDQCTHPDDWKPICSKSLCKNLTTEHLLTFTHTKPSCKAGARCNNQSEQHRDAVIHPEGWKPLCPDIGQCVKSGRIDHREEYAHDVLPCPLGVTCPSTSPLHAEQTSHPVRWKTPATSDKRKRCKFLGNCTNDSPDHLKKYNHEPVLCLQGELCADASLVHAAQALHPAGWKPVCTVPRCKDHSAKHVEYFSHPRAICTEWHRSQDVVQRMGAATGGQTAPAPAVPASAAPVPTPTSDRAEPVPAPASSAPPHNGSMDSDQMCPSQDEICCVMSNFVKCCGVVGDLVIRCPTEYCADDSSTHTKEFQHPSDWLPYCAALRTQGYCSNTAAQHRKDRSHAKLPCPKGMQCDMSIELHAQQMSHPSNWLPRCANGRQCGDVSERHRRRFFHFHPTERSQRGSATSS